MGNQRKGKGKDNSFIKPKIVSWIVRWLNAIEKSCKSRNQLRKCKANIICLQETNLKLLKYIKGFVGLSASGLVLFTI